MSLTADEKRLEKHIPSNILCSLAYIDYKVFPIECDQISKTEMLRILHYFLRTGEDLKTIKKLLVDVTEGKDNDLTSFVKNYKQKKKSYILENFVMLFIGFFITFGFLVALFLLRDK